MERRTKLLDAAIEQVQSLPPERQNAIAGVILAELDNQPDPMTARFQHLIKVKYTTGLTPEEVAELKAIEAAYTVRDEAFYRPILDRIDRKLAAARKRRATTK